MEKSLVGKGNNGTQKREYNILPGIIHLMNSPAVQSLLHNLPALFDYLMGKEAMKNGYNYPLGIA